MNREPWTLKVYLSVVVIVIKRMEYDQLCKQAESKLAHHEERAVKRSRRCKTKYSCRLPGQQPNQDDYEAGQAFCTQSLALFRQLGDQPGIALTLYRLGLLVWWKGQSPAARALEEEALAFFDRLESAVEKEIKDVLSCRDPGE